MMQASGDTRENLAAIQCMAEWVGRRTPDLKALEIRCLALGFSKSYSCLNVRIKHFNLKRIITY